MLSKEKVDEILCMLGITSEESIDSEKYNTLECLKSVRVYAEDLT